MVALAPLLLPLIQPPLLLPAPKKAGRKPLLSKEEIQTLEEEANALLKKCGAQNIKAEFKNEFGMKKMIFSGTTHKTVEAAQASVAFSNNHREIKMVHNVQKVEPIDIVLQELEKLENKPEGLKLSPDERRVYIYRRLRELNQ